jgi:hypothetical protein
VRGAGSGRGGWPAVVGGLPFALALLTARGALGDVPLAKTESGWEFFTNGRVGAFVEYVNGDGLPQTSVDASGMQGHSLGDGGFDFVGERKLQANGGATQGRIEGSRVRSGFVGNVLAFGVRHAVTDSTKATAYIATWHEVETEARRKYREDFPDVREGYLRLEGPWGSLLVGRGLTLFSRGATEIDYLYGHRYGVGNPAGFDNHGPSGGHVGFGVLASGFAAGIAYATPVLAGFQLTVGYYDPNNFAGLSWERTKWGRPEAELTFDAAFGDTARLHLFANGGWQKVYEANGPRDTSVYGAGYGGRLELWRLRLGLAGHYGRGLGLAYAFDANNAVVATAHDDELRIFDGYYAQLMMVLGRVDLSAGWGVTRVHELAVDLIPDPMTHQVPLSVIRQQAGISAAIVVHLTDFLHADVDYFRADSQWWLGERQVLHTLNGGLTLTW